MKFVTDNSCILNRTKPKSQLVESRPGILDRTKPNFDLFSKKFGLIQQVYKKNYFFSLINKFNFQKRKRKKKPWNR